MTSSLRRTCQTACSALLGLGVLSSTAAADDVEIDYSGFFQTDLRFRIGGNTAGTWVAPSPEPYGVVRNQSILKSRLTATSGKFSGVADIDLVMIGWPDPTPDIGSLSSRRLIDPFRIEAHALYIEARDLLPGLDIRLGQQLAQFGVGDQFNPTNNVNANDVEDPLLFGDQLANIMARADWYFKGLQVTGILIPVAKASTVPLSGRDGLMNTGRLPFIDDELRWRVHAEQAAGVNFGYPTVVRSATPELPAPSLENMQGFFRVGGWVAGQDIAISYYRGFSDIPQAAANHTVQDLTLACNPNDPEDCISGVLNTDVRLVYPRMQVFGLNMAGEVPLLGNLAPPFGYRLELAVVQPQAQSITVTQDEIAFSIITEPAGEYEYELEGGGRPLVLDARPFAKWTLGLDYTLGRHLYINAQWVHGMLDEMGAGDALFQDGYAARDGGVDSDAAATTACALNRDGEQCAWETLRRRINDYVVIGTDINFQNGNGLFRLFTILDVGGVFDERWDAGSQSRVRTHYSMFTPEGFAAVIYPELSYRFGNGLKLDVGALFNLGKAHSKFGDPAAGGSFVYTRGRFSF